MNIRRIRLYRIEIPFTLSVNHNLKRRTRSDALVAQIETEEGRVGYGEGAPRKYVNNVGFDEVIKYADSTLKTLQNLEVMNIQDVISCTSQIMRAKFLPSLASAVEIGLMDLLARRDNRPLAHLIGPNHDQPLKYSAVVPFLSAKNQDRILSIVEQVGFTAVKVKVGTVEDIKQIRNIKKVLGEDVDIRVDANRAWTYDKAIEMIPQLNELEVSSVEEPLIARQIDRLPELAQEIKVSLMLDESVYNLVQAKHFFERIAPQQLLFNIKISKSTGLLGAHRLYQFARRHKIECQLGCNVGETAILSAAGRIFAQTHAMKHLEGSYAPFFMQDDIGTEPINFGRAGLAEPLLGAGLGIEIDSNKLDKYGEVIAEINFPRHLALA